MGWIVLTWRNKAVISRHLLRAAIVDVFWELGNGLTDRRFETLILFNLLDLFGVWTTCVCLMCLGRLDPFFLCVFPEWPSVLTCLQLKHSVLAEPEQWVPSRCSDGSRFPLVGAARYALGAAPQLLMKAKPGQWEVPVEVLLWATACRGDSGVSSQVYCSSQGYKQRHSHDTSKHILNNMSQHKLNRYFTSLFQRLVGQKKKNISTILKSRA